MDGGAGAPDGELGAPDVGMPEAEPAQAGQKVTVEVATTVLMVEVTLVTVLPPVVIVLVTGQVVKVEYVVTVT